MVMNYWSCQRNLLRLKTSTDLIRIYDSWKRKICCGVLDTDKDRVKIENAWYAPSTAAKVARVNLSKKHNIKLPRNNTVAGLDKWKRRDNGVPVSEWILHCNAVVERSMALQKVNISKTLLHILANKGKRIFTFIDGSIGNICDKE